MVVVHGGAPAGGLVLVAKALRPANGVSVCATIFWSSRWCYGYILVRRGGWVRKWWPRHDGGGVSAACACSATTSMGLGGVSAARGSPLVSKAKGWWCRGGS